MPVELLKSVHEIKLSNKHHSVPTPARLPSIGPASELSSPPADALFLPFSKRSLRVSTKKLSGGQWQGVAALV